MFTVNVQPTNTFELWSFAFPRFNKCSVFADWLRDWKVWSFQSVAAPKMRAYWKSQSRELIRLCSSFYNLEDKKIFAKIQFSFMTFLKNDTCFAVFLHFRLLNIPHSLFLCKLGLLVFFPCKVSLGRCLRACFFIMALKF